MECCVPIQMILAQLSECHNYALVFENISDYCLCNDIIRQNIIVLNGIFINRKVAIDRLCF